MATSTPWGPSQSSKKHERGITSYTTASHGGFKVSPTLNQAIHPAWRSSTGWYEEDCAWAIVAYTFADRFPALVVASAIQTVRDWFPDEYEAATGHKVPLSDSHVLRERDWEKAHAADFKVRSVIGIPGTGLVHVWASTKFAEVTRLFEVPEADYSVPFAFAPGTYPDVTDSHAEHEYDFLCKKSLPLFRDRTDKKVS